MMWLSGSLVILGRSTARGHQALARYSSFAGNDLFQEIRAGGGAFKYHCDGEWLESSSGKTVGVVNPCTRRKEFEVQACTQQEVDTGYQAARAAQKAWARTPLWKRADLLHKAAALMRQHAQPIADCLVREIAKPAKQSLDEVIRCASSQRFGPGPVLARNRPVQTHGQSAMSGALADRASTRSRRLAPLNPASWPPTLLAAQACVATIVAPAAAPVDRIHRTHPRSADLIDYTAEEGVRSLGKGELLTADSFPGQTRNKLCLVSQVRGAAPGWTLGSADALGQRAGWRVVYGYGVMAWSPQGPGGMDRCAPRAASRSVKGMRPVSSWVGHVLLSFLLGPLWVKLLRLYKSINFTSPPETHNIPPGPAGRGAGHPALQLPGQPRRLQARTRADGRQRRRSQAAVAGRRRGRTPGAVLRQGRAAEGPDQHDHGQGEDG